MTESLVSPEEIRERLQTVRSNGYPPTDVVSLLEDLVRFCTGAAAEEAVDELIAHLHDDELMSALVRSYVIRESRSSSTKADYNRGARLRRADGTGSARVFTGRRQHRDPCRYALWPGCHRAVEGEKRNKAQRGNNLLSGVQSCGVADHAE
jgi:hypothetical protein